MKKIMKICIALLILISLDAGNVSHIEANHSIDDGIKINIKGEALPEY